MNQEEIISKCIHKNIVITATGNYVFSKIMKFLLLPYIDLCKGLCQNDGQCLRTPSGAKCICLPGWTGKHCEEGERKYRQTKILSL